MKILFQNKYKKIIKINFRSIHKIYKMNMMIQIIILKKSQTKKICNSLMMIIKIIQSIKYTKLRLVNTKD